MMRALYFARRNFKEIIRDVLSFVFCFAFPVLLFLMMELIVAGIGADISHTPQFAIEKLYPSICVFSFSFLMLFSSMLISKDRQSSFQIRLIASPLKTTEIIIGYALPLLLIASMQFVVITIVGFFFGVQLNFNILITFLCLIPVIILFINLGLIIGTLFSDKAGSGISSLIINIAVLMGGMFFPLENMTGFLPVLCNIFPIAPALKLVSCFTSGVFSGIFIPIITIILYVLITFALAVFVIFKRMRSDNK